MKIIQCRIVGNELLPRDQTETELSCLKWIVENGNLINVKNLWVLNNIVDPAYRAKVISLLKDQDTIEMTLDLKSYHAKKTWDEKVVSLININAARNYGVKYAQKKCDFVVCLDQDCYFLRSEWKSIVRTIEKDQKTNNRKYYGVNSKRIHIDQIPKSLKDIEIGEAMPIFRHDANQYFNANIPFGKADKVELLMRLGYNQNSTEITGDLCRTVGSVAHMTFGNNDIMLHKKIREESLTLLMSKLEVTDVKKIAVRKILM